MPRPASSTPKDTATVTLNQALAAFEEIGTPPWADRARAELARTNGPHAKTCSPPLSGGRPNGGIGKTNRDVASALFISPKTVEANLARIYRKLGINSRAELGRLIGERACYASVRLRVTAGSTGMPGPVVVDTTTFFR